MHAHRLFRRLFFAALSAAALPLAGCGKAQKLEQNQVKKEPVTVSVFVFDDPALAESIQKLKGEWHAVSGNTLEVAKSESLDSAAHHSPGTAPHDIAIIPAESLGGLIQSDEIAAVPDDVHSGAAAAWSDYFLLVQQGVNWGDEIWAIPFGSPELTLLYRRDLFEKFHKSPPTTWAEYQSLVAFFSKRENLGDAAPPADAPWQATLEPTAAKWSGRLLLARAAAYAKHRDNYSTLLNVDTMEPLIAGEPFVRALEELVAADGKQQPRLDPAEVRKAFLAGQSAMALTWPTAARALPSAADEPQGQAEPPEIKVGFAELPGAAQMYNFTSGKWDPRNDDESVHVPLVPLAGRVGVVLKKSPHPEAAFELLVWLSGQKWGTRVASASDQTTLYRRSQRNDVAKWVESSIDRAAARQYAEVLSDGLSRSVWVDGLRIPEAGEYYAALDEAVAAALDGTATPSAALKVAAEKWQATTDRLGLERQKSAYRKSLGLDP